MPASKNSRVRKPRNRTNKRTYALYHVVDGRERQFGEQTWSTIQEGETLSPATTANLAHNMANSFNSRFLSGNRIYVGCVENRELRSKEQVDA